MFQIWWQKKVTHSFKKYLKSSRVWYLWTFWKELINQKISKLGRNMDWTVHNLMWTRVWIRSRIWSFSKKVQLKTLFSSYIFNRQLKLHDKVTKQNRLTDYCHLRWKRLKSLTVTQTINCFHWQLWIFLPFLLHGLIRPTVPTALIPRWHNVLSLHLRF